MFAEEPATSRFPLGCNPGWTATCRRGHRKPRLGRWAALAFAALAVPALGGCAAGVAGAIAAVLGSSDDSGGVVERTRVATDLALVTPPDGQTDRVKLPVLLQVDSSEDVEVTSVEYSLRGDETGAYRPATAARGFPADFQAGDRLRGSDVAERDDDFLFFIWNSRHDLNRLMESGEIRRPASARAVLRMRVQNLSTREVRSAVTGEFLLDEGLLATFAGGGVGDGGRPEEASMFKPSGIGCDARGNIYVADTGNHRVRRMDMARGDVVAVRTMAGNGFAGILPGLQPATRTSLNNPLAVAVARNGDFFLSELIEEEGRPVQGVVRLTERDSGFISLLADGFLRPGGLAMETGRFLWVTDEDAGRIARLDVGGIGSSGPVAGIEFRVGGRPAAIGEDPGKASAVIYTDIADGTVRTLRVDGTDAVTRTVAGGGARNPAQERDRLITESAAGTEIRFLEPRGVASDGEHVYVTDHALGVLVVLSAEEFAVRNIIGGLEQPLGVVVEGGAVFVIESGVTEEDLRDGIAPSGHVVRKIVRPESPADIQAEIVAGNSEKRLSQPVDRTSFRSSELDLTVG